MSEDPYAILRPDEGSGDSQFAVRLGELVQKMDDAKRLVEKKEDELAAAQKAYTELERNIIPSHMQSGNTIKHVTSSGLEVEVQTRVRHSLSKERQPEGYDWLEKNQHGALIKRCVEVAFNIDQQEDAVKLMQELEDRFPTTKQSRKVEASTLKKFIKETMADDDRKAKLPFALFGIHEYDVAVVKKAKK